MRRATARVRCRFRRSDRTNWIEDREVDHGEEKEGEERIHQKEGRSGAQKAQDSKGGGKAVDQEKVGSQGGSQAPSLGTQARGAPDAGSRTSADAFMEPAERLRRRRERNVGVS